MRDLPRWWLVQRADGTRVDAIRPHKVVLGGMGGPAAHQLYIMGATRCPGRLGIKY